MSTAAHEASSSGRASYNTVQQAPRQRRSLTFRAQLTSFCALTAILTAIILSAVLAVVWEGQFSRYTRENMEQLAQTTANTLAAEYEVAGRWTEEVLAYASYASLTSNDITVQVISVNGNVLYDDTWANVRLSDKLKTKLSAVPHGADSVVSADVTTSNGRVVGTVKLWAFGSDALLTKKDAAFRSSSYTAIIGAAVAAVALAFFIGYAASRELARSINAITRTAKQIRGGDLTARTGLRGNDEIGQLGETFDSMATTLEHDIKIEHRLTSDVAHELRTPLMAMLATVEAMQDGVLPADDEHFETVASETRRLSRLVDAMLRLSRMENGKTSIKIEHTDMIFLVRSIVNAQHQLFHDQGLHLRFANETTREELFADIDPDLIREAIVNLLSNAMRYTPEGGWILTTVGHEREDVLVMVQDTGIGIAKEDLAHVFARFWRSDASRERARGGLGVGLAITKEIIDRHNGTIEVESEVGRGTIFTLRIPQNRADVVPQFP